MQISIGMAAYLVLNGRRCDPLTDALKSVLGSDKMRDPAYTPTQADIDAIGRALDIADAQSNAEWSKQIGKEQWHGGIYTQDDFHAHQNEFIAAYEAIKKIAHLVGLYKPESHQTDWPA